MATIRLEFDRRRRALAVDYLRFLKTQKGVEKLSKAAKSKDEALLVHWSYCHSPSPDNGKKNLVFGK
ncbi:Peptide deformylase [Dirofilaria immitis]